MSAVLEPLDSEIQRCIEDEFTVISNRLGAQNRVVSDSDCTARVIQHRQGASDSELRGAAELSIAGRGEACGVRHCVTHGNCRKREVPGQATHAKRQTLCEDSTATFAALDVADVRRHPKTSVYTLDGRNSRSLDAAAKANLARSSLDEAPLTDKDSSERTREVILRAYLLQKV